MKKHLKIKIRSANWKSDTLFLGKKINITTYVIMQNNIVIDPGNRDFLAVVFKEYVHKKLQKQDAITLNLSATDLFFYGENANVYMLNYIYASLFPKRHKKPFDPVLESDEGSINIGLFNAQVNQIVYLIEILYALKIDFKKLLKKYMLLSFPESLDYCDDEKISELSYRKVKEFKGVKK